MERNKTKIDNFLNDYFSDVDFDKQEGKKNLPEEVIWGLKYEYFVNSFDVYNIKRELDAEDIKRLSTGTLKGIDNFYIIINGKFLTIPNSKSDPDYKDFEKEISERLKDDLIQVDFHFTQVKTKDISLAELNAFCDTIYDIFKGEDTTLYKNSKIKILKDAFDKIGAKTEDINLNIKCVLIKKDSMQLDNLVKTWEGDIERKKKALKSTIFKKVELFFSSGQDYISRLNNFNSPNKRSYEVQGINKDYQKIEIEKAVTYIGFISIKEVISLLTDEDGNFDYDKIFFDNLRGFGGYTDVNSKIRRSLNTNAGYFHMLHNGIIVTSGSSQYNPSNGNMIIENFSIVNGCQTCNIIWDWYQNIKKESGFDIVSLDRYRIPIKIVITGDPELRNKITEAANTQNPIKSINLIAISEAAKLLEVQFKQLTLASRGEELTFQRLLKDKKNTSANTILLEDVARAFYSSFGKEPHNVSRSFGKYLDQKLKDDDFLSDKKEHFYDVNSYLISSIAYNYIARFLKSRYKALQSLRNHFLLLFFVHIAPDFEEKNPRKLDQYWVRNVLSIIDDKTKFDNICEEICSFSISKLSSIVDNRNTDKPKVISKSYYSEVNTKNMLSMYKEYINTKEDNG